jgi:hypothetical protein
VWSIFAGELTAEVEDGIPDELAGAMIGDVATALDLVNFYALGCEVFVIEEDVGAVGVAAEGQDGRVLEEDERIADLVGFAGSNDLGLDAKALSVGDATEL